METWKSRTVTWDEEKWESNISSYKTLRSLHLSSGIQEGCRSFSHTKKRSFSNTKIRSFSNTKNGHFSTQLRKINDWILTAAKILRNVAEKKGMLALLGLLHTSRRTHIFLHLYAIYFLNGSME